MPDVAELTAGDFTLRVEFMHGPSGAQCLKGLCVSRVSKGVRVAVPRTIGRSKSGRGATTQRLSVLGLVLLIVSGCAAWQKERKLASHCEGAVSGFAAWP